MRRWLTLWATLVFIGIFTTPGFALVTEYSAESYSTPSGATQIASRTTSDLDHYYYYVWSMNDVAQPVGGLNIVFHDISNWTREANWLSVYLFDLPSGTASTWQRVYDNQSTSSPDWSALYATAVSLGTWSYISTAKDVVFSITDAAVLAYLSNGGSFGIGIDPDCHYYLDGITVETMPQTAPVPEPATLLLLGCGLMGAGVFRKRFIAR
jgi:hypothetical protein